MILNSENCLKWQFMDIYVLENSYVYVYTVIILLHRLHLYSPWIHWQETEDRYWAIHSSYHIRASPLSWKGHHHCHHNQNHNQSNNHNKNKKSKKKKPATPVLFWFKVLQFVLVILMYFLDCLSFLLPILQSLEGLAAFAKLGLGCLQEAWGLTLWWSHWSASVGSIGHRWNAPSISICMIIICILYKQTVKKLIKLYLYWILFSLNQSEVHYMMPSELCKICLVAGAEVELSLICLWSSWSSWLAATIEMLWSVHVKTAFLRQNTYWLWPENLWKHLLHQTCFRETIWHDNKCHFKVFGFQWPFCNKKSPPFSGGSKAALYFLEGLVIRRLDVKTPNLGVSWWSNLTFAYFFQSGWLVQPPENFLLEKFCTLYLQRHVPFIHPSKPQGILSQAARICVFYYHCPSQRDFLNPELKVIWSF